MSIESLRFENFKVFRDATLPLCQTTLIVGPNGAGKSTCMQAIELLASITGAPTQHPPVQALRSFNSAVKKDVKIEVTWRKPSTNSTFIFGENPQPFRLLGDANEARILKRARVFSFDPKLIAQPGDLQKTLEISASGHGIPSVLTSLQDQFPERFEELNKDLARWLPEFDRVLLDTPQPNSRSFMLRTKEGRHAVPAHLLSQGTLFSVALLTLCHLPNPPPLIGIEDPDRGMHPRLLRDVLDAINRLSSPTDSGETRPPVQVILTTHSPYFLDLFRDRLEDVVIIEKQGLTSSFRNISTIPNVQEILHDAHLGESWFNGILGGVPVQT